MGKLVLFVAIIGTAAAAYTFVLPRTDYARDKAAKQMARDICDDDRLIETSEEVASFLENGGPMISGSLRLTAVKYAAKARGIGRDHHRTLQALSSSEFSEIKDWSADVKKLVVERCPEHEDEARTTAEVVALSFGN